MYFSQEALKQLADEHAALNKWESQFIRFTHRPFENERAREHAVHGYARRNQMLVRSIRRVFEILPPEREDIPSRDEVRDATMYIQAFVTNAFGSLENLAWIWVLERNVKRPNGSDLPDSWVGFRKGNTIVRKSLPADFQKYLESLDEWLTHLVDFRDALAHRIPLYIPPYIITDEHAAEYGELQQRMNQALRDMKPDVYDDLHEQQKALGKFRPWMVHSLAPGGKYVVFHAQLHADFNTIYEIADKLLEELDRG